MFFVRFYNGNHFWIVIGQGEKGFHNLLSPFVVRCDIIALNLTQNFGNIEQ